MPPQELLELVARRTCQSVLMVLRKIVILASVVAASGVLGGFTAYWWNPAGFSTARNDPAHLTRRSPYPLMPGVAASPPPHTRPPCCPGFALRAPIRPAARPINISSAGIAATGPQRSWSTASSRPPSRGSASPPSSTTPRYVQLDRITPGGEARGEPGGASVDPAGLRPSKIDHVALSREPGPGGDLRKDTEGSGLVRDHEGARSRGQAHQG